MCRWFSRVTRHIRDPALWEEYVGGVCGTGPDSSVRSTHSPSWRHSLWQTRGRERKALCVFTEPLYTLQCVLFPLLGDKWEVRRSNTTHRTMLVPRDDRKKNKLIEKDTKPSVNCPLISVVKSMGYLPFRLLVLIPELSLGQKVANFSHKVNWSVCVCVCRHASVCMRAPHLLPSPASLSTCPVPASISTPTPLPTTQGGLQLPRCFYYFSVPPLSIPLSNPSV